MQEYTVTVDRSSTRWWQDGKLHRLDGPAMVCTNGDKMWLQNGRIHRLDGPAVEYANGTKAWYIEGKILNEEEFLERTRPVKELTVEEISKLLGYEVKVVKG